jgi:Mg-chelatase subunit ChlD
MPHFSFIHPGALWLLLLLVPLWALALLAPRRFSPLRFWSSLVLRTLLVLALVLSLAGTQLVRNVDEVTTVFLVDSSDSVQSSSFARAQSFLREALGSKGRDDQAAIVVFGDNALVERAPDTSRLLGRLASEPVATRTDIEEAIQLGMALFPSDTRRHLVLLSDGGENTGSAASAAQIAAARNIPIDIVDLSMFDLGDEALVTGLDAPDEVRDGQEIELVATVESSTDQRAVLRIFANQDIVTERTVQLAEGNNQFSVMVPAEGQGFRHYRAQIEPMQDGRPQNNEAAALVHIQGPPRVLLVEGTRGEAANLLDALQAANMNAERTAPETMPSSLAGLSAYEAVVLINVAARDLPIEAVAALPTYVRDLGKGLVMVGGDESYGMGGYGNTPIEEALPVYMDVRNREDRPDLALVFIIDKSGSMDACHCAGPNMRSPQLNERGERKIDIAREAVTQASALLGARDTLGVVAFDTDAEWLLPAQRGIEVSQVVDAIADVQPLGNTNVRAGLQSAEEALNSTDASIKHAVLLTDGWGEGINSTRIDGRIVDIAARMREEGITLSTVAAGSGSATFLEQLATSGGGRYYLSEDMTDVPEIFLQETILAAGHYIVEEPFIPSVAHNSPVLQNLDSGMPPLYGYNGSTLKDSALGVLVANDDAPVLAQWQYGLGRSIAWTSDTKGQWARDWVTWEGFPRFAAQMIDWVIPAEPTQNVETNIRVEGAQTTIVVTVQNAEGTPHDQLQMRAALLRDQDSDASESALLPEVALRQVAPGEYQATIPSPDPGTYFVQIQGQENGRTTTQHIAGLVVPYSPEYRQGQGNVELLQSLAQMTGGSEIVAPEMAFASDLPVVMSAHEIALSLLLLALLLLPLDIAARRVLIHRRDLAGVRQWLRRVLASRAAAPAATTAKDDPILQRLAQAKSRATGRSHSQTPAAPPEAPPANDSDVPLPPPEMLHQQPPAPMPADPPPRTEAAAAPEAAASQDGPDALERLRIAKARARRRARNKE